MANKKEFKDIFNGDKKPLSWIDRLLKKLK